MVMAQEFGKQFLPFHDGFAIIGRTDDPLQARQ